MIGTLTYYAVGFLWKVASNMQDFVVTDGTTNIQEPSAKHIATSYVLRAVACVITVVGVVLEGNFLLVMLTIIIKSLRWE